MTLIKIIFSSVLGVFLIPGCSGSGDTISADKTEEGEPEVPLGVIPGPFTCDDYPDTTTWFSESASNFPDHKIPDCVFDLIHLKQLAINGQDCCGGATDKNGNRITYCSVIFEISPRIGELKELEDISMTINSISVLPKEMAELKKLKVLDLTDNAGITDCKVLSEMVSLEELYLHGCYIEKMPEDIGNLKNLKYLGLAGNNMDSTEMRRIEKALPNCEITF